MMPSIWMISVFIYCIWIGRYFEKRCKEHWTTFLFFPTAFLSAAFFSLLIQGSTLYWLTYLMGLWSGCIVGLLITNLVPVRIDLVRQRISAPGSRLILVCLMVLCVSKCAFDWLHVSIPEHNAILKLISFGIKGVVTGVFYGQALSFWYRVSIAGTYSPDELICGRFACFDGLQSIPAVTERDGCTLLAA